MKRSICIVITIIMLLLLCSCSNAKRTSVPVKIGIIDSCISKSMVKELDIKEYYELSGDITNNNITHGSIITTIIQHQAKNCDIFYCSIYDENCIGKVDYVVSAITWCIKNKVDIISMSFAMLQDNFELRQVIEQAQENGIILVASCINLSNKVCYPAMYKGVISVTDGFNQSALISLKGKVIKVKLCGQTMLKSEVSFLTAYACGLIAKKLSNGATLDVILKKSFLSKKEGGLFS